MGEVIGDILPLALGITISPIPIIAAILLLLSPKAKGTSVGFLVGWILGILIVLAVFILLASVITPADPDQPQPISGAIKLLLGALMLVLAIKQWRGRPRDGAEPSMPAWMSAIDQLTAAKGLGLGLLLSAVNPKNLLMGASAGVTIGSAGLPFGSTVVTVALFTAIAAASVAVPVIGYLAAAEAMSGPLEELRCWLTSNNATVMAVLLLVIGVMMIGKGIGNF